MRGHRRRLVRSVLDAEAGLCEGALGWLSAVAAFVAKSLSHIPVLDTDCRAFRSQQSAVNDLSSLDYVYVSAAVEVLLLQV